MQCNLNMNMNIEQKCNAIYKKKVFILCNSNNSNNNNNNNNIFVLTPFESNHEYTDILATTKFTT